MTKTNETSGPKSQNPLSGEEDDPATEQAAAESRIHQLVILGSGPAGLAGALYAARAGTETIVFERASVGGELPNINHLANYPGYSGTGAKLAANMQTQAEQAGAKFSYGECSGIHILSPEEGSAASPAPRPGCNVYRLTIDNRSVLTYSILIATGSEPRRLDFTPQAPVSYCALCDGDLVRGKSVAVVGGANSAVQESIYLSSLASSVTLISHSALKADPALLSQLRSLPNISIRENLEPTPAILQPFDHIFVYIGKRPATSFLKNLSPDLLDPAGFVVTDQHFSALPGIFAAGDVRSGAVRQVITAAAEGAAAAISASTYLKSHHLS